MGTIHLFVELGDHHRFNDRQQFSCGGGRDTALDPARIDDDARALVSYGTAAALLDAVATDAKD